MDDDSAFREAAMREGASATAAEHLLRVLEGRLSRGAFYVYRVSEGGGGTSGGTGKRRTLLAFSDGDDALAFAQRNRLGPTPRLLRLSLAQLLTIVLHRPTVEAVLFVAAVGDEVRPGQLPSGYRLARTSLLADLTADDGQNEQNVQD